MGAKKSNPRNNVLHLRVDDYTLAELQGRLNDESTSNYLLAALEEKLVRDRQRSMDDFLKGSHGHGQ